MDDTVGLMRALMARDETGGEQRGRAPRLRRFLRDADLSWLRAPLPVLVALASVGAAALAPSGGIGAAVLAARAGLAAATGTADAIIGAALADRDTAVFAIAAAVGGPALLLFLMELLADLRRTFGR